MNPRRSAIVAAAVYPTAVILGWAFVSFAGVASPQIEHAAAAYVADDPAPAQATSTGSIAPPQEVAPVVPPVLASSDPAPPMPDVAMSLEFAPKPAADATTPPEQPPVVVATLGDPAEVLAHETAPEPTPPATTAALPPPQNTAAPTGRIEIVGECIVVDPCIDEFLWALYQRSPKEDTVKETEKRKVEIKRKGRLVTVTRSFTKLVDSDFAWKDPKAAERAGMSMTDYVIGGMDRSFKLKLFHMLYAAEAAGLQPGISSAFRDDYRQSIASGLKAASNRSYHGGSLRGGYGHGLAADIVSVNGANRAERWTATEILWKWVDTNGKQFGIGRPYLAFDPPHVGPIDGPEYIAKRGSARFAEAKKPHQHLAHNHAHGKPSSARRPVVASR